MDRQPSSALTWLSPASSFFKRMGHTLYTFQLLGLRHPREGLSEKVPHFSSTRDGYFQITIPHLHLVNSVTKAYIENLSATYLKSQLCFAPTQVLLFAQNPPLKVSINPTGEELKKTSSVLKKKLTQEKMSPAPFLVSHWFTSHPTDTVTTPATTLDSTTEVQLAWVLLNKSSTRKPNVSFSLSIIL